MVESSKKLPAWRSAVVLAAKQERLRNEMATPFDEPLKLVIDVFLPRPAKPKWNFVPASKPDVDKLARAIMDALTIAEVIKDDALVCELNIKKLWAAHNGSMPVPGAIVSVIKLL
jgi:crossover junction endodeoxyribonuclease RusA